MANFQKELANNGDFVASFSKVFNTAYKNGVPNDILLNFLSRPVAESASAVRATMWQALTLGANALGTSLTAPKNLATSLDHLWVMVAIGKISRAIKPHTRQKQATPSHLAPAKLVLIELTATWPSSKTLRKTDLS